MAVNYQFDKKRFEAFIDAIFAILLTILVLEIKIPEDKIENTSTYEQVRSLTPYIVSYLASFMLIVGFWIDYHLLFASNYACIVGMVSIVSKKAEADARGSRPCQLEVLPPFLLK